VPYTVTGGQGKLRLAYAVTAVGEGSAVDLVDIFLFTQ
jgi:hypothetical protein